MTSELQVHPGADVPLEITIRNIEALPPRTILLLRGLPPGIHLSEGRFFGNRLWVVPLNRISRLKASISAEAVGRTELGVSLTTLEGKPITASRLALIVSPAAVAQNPAAKSNDAAPPARAAKVPPALLQPKSPDRDLALKLYKNGNDNLEAGNVLVARQFFQRAAEYGSAEAARSLGATYDPAILSQMKNVVGILPNAELAEKWYQIARELQSQEVRVDTR
jgi:hypothetical protein